MFQYFLFSTVTLDQYTVIKKETAYGVGVRFNNMKGNKKKNSGNSSGLYSPEGNPIYLS